MNRIRYINNGIYMFGTLLSTYASTLMKITREKVTKLLTYGSLQAIIEGAIAKIPHLTQVDQSQLKIHIFNRIMKRAQQIKHSA